MHSKVRFIATLSDGSTITEGSGEWTVQPGQRSPWIRLAQFATKNKLHLTSLRLDIDGRTVHMPRERFERFGLEGVEPHFYSLSYQLEVDNINSGGGKQSHFVNLTAHFDDFEVHYVQDVEGTTSWIIVTRDFDAIAPTPRRQVEPD